MFIPLSEDGPGGRSCEERRLEPEPICLSAGCRPVRTRLSAIFTSGWRLTVIVLFLCGQQIKICSNPFRDSAVLILAPSMADKQVISSSERLLSAEQEEEASEGAVTWTETEGEELNQGIRLKIQHPKVRKKISIDLLIDSGFLMKL